MVIQIILLVAIAVLTFLLTRSTAGARHQAIRRLMLVGFVVLAVLSVLFPAWLSWLARAVGVGRGTDLLLYALVIAFLSSIATTYQQLGALNRRITVLTRRLALLEADRYSRAAGPEQVAPGRPQTVFEEAEPRTSAGPAGDTTRHAE